MRTEQEMEHYSRLISAMVKHALPDDVAFFMMIMPREGPGNIAMLGDASPERILQTFTKLNETFKAGNPPIRPIREN